MSSREDYRCEGRNTEPGETGCRLVAAVAPAQFSFGWGYTLLVGARIQNEYRREQGKKPEALFSIHRG